MCVCVGRTCWTGHFTYMWVWSRYGRRVGSHVDCRRLGGMVVVVVGLLLLRIGKEWMFGPGNVGGGSGHALFVCHFGFVGQHDFDTVIDMRNGVWSFGHGTPHFCVCVWLLFILQVWSNRRGLSRRVCPTILEIRACVVAKNRVPLTNAR